MISDKNRAVFISYASKNFKLADEIRYLIENRGISCWIAPRDIPPGASYGEEISSAIEQCSAVIFVMTEDANQSRAVANELELAFRYQRVIIPIRLNNIEPAQSLRFYISNVQWVDAIYTPLKKRIEVLINIINAALNDAPIPSPLTENKTLLGSLERRLEGLIRYKMLTGFVVFFLAIITSIALFLLSSSTLYQLKADKALNQLDPSTYGLVTLNYDDENSSGCNTEELNLRAAIYVNLHAPREANLKIQSRTISPKGSISQVNLSEIHTFNAADVQNVFFCVPKDIPLITFCMSAKHPDLNERYAAKWTYRIQRDKGDVKIVRELDPKLYGGNLANCEINQI